jgi:hypothetical protein
MEDQPRSDSAEARKIWANGTFLSDAPRGPAHGPDPLHLAAVFGFDPKTAIRYAENARALLASTAERQDPAGRDEPKGRQPT